MGAQNQREPDFLDKVLQSQLSIFIVIALLFAVAFFLGKKYLAHVTPGYAYIQRQLQRPPPTLDDPAQAFPDSETRYDDESVFGLATSDLSDLRTGHIDGLESFSPGSDYGIPRGQPPTSANLTQANTEVLAAASVANGRPGVRSASLSHQPRLRHNATNRVVVHVGGVTLGAVEESELARRRANTLSRGRSQ